MGIWVRYFKMPAGFNSFVRKTGDDYTIMINPNSSFDMQREAYLHEAEHLRYADLERDLNVNEIERERHK